MISAICVSCRDEVAKAIRRALGDTGGVKFRHGTYNFRGSWSNAIDTVTKDNLLMEVYEIAGNALDATSRNCDVGAPQFQTDLFGGM